MVLFFALALAAVALSLLLGLGGGSSPTYGSAVVPSQPPGIQSQGSAIGGGAGKSGTAVSGSSFSTSPPTSDSVATSAYMKNVLTNPYNPMVAVYIPRYSYFQGLAYSKGDTSLVGQVRVLGGAVSEGQTNLQPGAMGTTNPEYFKSRLQAPNSRYQIVEWKEVEGPQGAGR